jgi:hypothetical protein
MAASTPTTRYLAPDAFTRRVMNPLVARLTRWGVSVKGPACSRCGAGAAASRAPPWSTSSQVDGVRYLVAPRGETEWVRNLRAAGTGTLRVGRRVEPFAAVELADDDKPPVLRRYLAAWAWEVGRFFEGLRADSPDADLAAAAPGFPVFRMS